jgi:methionyl-tRNA formyltransferase
MKNVRIVFMGTPEFAVVTLGSLLMNGFNVVGVVTTPDKPAGRGQKVTQSAVKQFAEFSHLPVLQPESLRDPEFIKKLRDFNADFFVVVAFRMLPQVIWKLPASGTINLHASLLPHYRGAAPINHVLINGEQITGVTTFFINENIDTGEILLREEVQIFPHENAGDLHNRLMKTGARLVVRTLQGLIENTIVAVPQKQFLKPGENPKLAPKIFPQTCIVNWEREASEIQNQIRGLSPYPCAKSFFRGEAAPLSFKIFESKALIESHNLKPGSIVSDGKHFLKVACRNGFIDIISLQLEGKKRMTAPEFLRGFRIQDYKEVFSQPV